MTSAGQAGQAATVLGMVIGAGYVMLLQFCKWLNNVIQQGVEQERDGSEIER